MRRDASCPLQLDHPRRNDAKPHHVPLERRGEVALVRRVGRRLRVGRCGLHRPRTLA
jgi:hypothetical protein